MNFTNIKDLIARGCSSSACNHTRNTRIRLSMVWIALATTKQRAIYHRVLSEENCGSHPDWEVTPNMNLHSGLLFRIVWNSILHSKPSFTHTLHNLINLFDCSTIINSVQWACLQYARKRCVFQPGAMLLAYYLQNGRSGIFYGTVVL